MIAFALGGGGRAMFVKESLRRKSLPQKHLRQISPDGSHFDNRLLDTFSTFWPTGKQDSLIGYPMAHDGPKVCCLLSKLSFDATR